MKKFVVLLIFPMTIIACRFNLVSQEAIFDNQDESCTQTASPSPSVTFTAIASFTPTDTPLPTDTPTLTPTQTRIYILPSATPYVGGGSGSGDCGVTLNAGFENQIINLVNQQRVNQGLNPLSASGNLSSSARAHSIDMACNDYFSHLGGIAENIAAGYDSPSSVVSGWMASDGHRANILSEYYSEIGVGYAYYAESTYGHYWTAQFSP